MRASESIDEAREKQERTEQILEAVQSESVRREEEADNTETLTPDGGLAEDGIAYIQPICTTSPIICDSLWKKFNAEDGIACHTNIIEPNKSFTATTIEMTKEEIKAYIRETARRYGVDENKALKIAECESNFQNICNYEYGCSGGIGIFQLTQETFDEARERMGRVESFRGGELIASYIKSGTPESPYNIQDNIKVAIYLMSKGEYLRWEKSKHCWNPQTSSNPPAICSNWCQPYEYQLEDCSCVYETYIETRIENWKTSSPKENARNGDGL